VGLIAAYAVALQALLVAAGPVLPSAQVAGVLCVAHNDEGQPAQHTLPCEAMCAAMAAAVTGPLPPDIVVAVAAPVVTIALIPIPGWAVPHLALRGPQAPRGPPLV
jgi:hypothetical protein